MADINYIGNLLNQGEDTSREPDWPEDNWTPEAPPDDLPDLGDVPDDFFTSEALNFDEPPDDYFPPPHLVGVPEEVLDVPFGFVPTGDAPELPQDEAFDPGLLPGAEIPEEVPNLAAVPAAELPQPALGENLGDSGSVMQNPDVLVAPAAPSLWERYSDAFLAGRTLGGSEEAMLERANIINLQDAQFLGRSDEAGHHVSAVEMLVDPGSGERYGNVLDVATFQDAEQAEALYVELQGHVEDNSLPNYAVADLAAYAATERGTALDWHSVAEQDLAAYGVQGAAEEISDEPPPELIDSLNQEFAWLDPALFEGESPDYEREGYQDLDREPLDYGVRMGEDARGYSTVELFKEWEGGLRSGGGEDSRVIGAYENPADAQAVATDLWQVQQDVEDLTGNRVAGWQMIGSLGYEIAQANGALQAGEPLFVTIDGPADPFQVEPTQELFAQYQEMEQA